MLYAALFPAIIYFLPNEQLPFVLFFDMALLGCVCLFNV